MRFLFVLFILSAAFGARAGHATMPPDSVMVLVTDSTVLKEGKAAVPQFIRINKQKMTALILSFPFPFGIVGLHRIYFGCSPYVPVAYIASLGGAFGLIPLIDFFVILFEKDTSKFLNNKQVFMWVK